MPDNPEIHDATVVLSLITPGGIHRVILACPQVPGTKPQPPALKPPRRKHQ
jgi:hypothetical protein